ncbi:hypothetical protein BD779DRAFT_1434513, partial [Infundibulicybe gibba]
TRMLLNTLFSAIALFATSNASSDIVYTPHITSPNASTEWHAGATHNVTWDATCVPYEKRNDTGRIILGYKGDTTSENLDIGMWAPVTVTHSKQPTAIEHPLCTGFPIARGYVIVTMPSTVEPRNDYFIARKYTL